MSIVRIKINNSVREDELYCEFFECPSCKNDNIQDDFSFCPDCGKKIQWVNSRDKEKGVIIKDLNILKYPAFGFTFHGKCPNCGNDILAKERPEHCMICDTKFRWKKNKKRLVKS